jgi:hypothetical protein
METQIQMLDTELSRLERQCKAQDVDVRPWVSNDNPLSLQHWGVTQQRLRLLCPGRHGGAAKANQLPTAVKAKRTLSAAHLAALQAGRSARLASKSA